MKVYGRAILKKDTWEITGEPHVLMRAKRAIPAISKRASVTLKLSHTPEHCHDLEWFCERFPLDVEPRGALEEGARSHRDSVLLIEDILAGTHEPRPFELALAPRRYQAQAAELYLQTGSLLLADDLGLGKTCTAIASFCDPRALPAVVVAPAHLTRQWAREISKFAPNLFVHELKKTTPYKLPTRSCFGPEQTPDVLVTSYHKISGWATTLSEYVKSIVFDEVHELRREDSNKYRGATFVARAVPFRLGLSATPIFNYGGEIRTVLEVLRPGALGTKTEFVNEWCDGFGAEKIKNPKALGSFLRDSGLLLRRTRTDVGAELPELTRIIEDVPCDASAIDDIGDEAARLARIILNRGGEAGSTFQASGELDWRLRRATGVGKAAAVAGFVQMLCESEEKILLVGWHHDVYDIWQRAFDVAGIKTARFTGQESPAQKDAAFRAFTGGEAQVLMLSLRAGAGLDGLQGAASIVVFGEIDWSPAVHEQVIGRLHRPGQHNPVLAYFLVANEGSDPVVAEVLGLKREQLIGIRDAERASIEGLEVDADRVKRLAEDFLRRREEFEMKETA